MNLLKLRQIVKKAVHLEQVRIISLNADPFRKGRKRGLAVPPNKVDILQMRAGEISD